MPYLEQLDLSSNQLDLISKGAFENLAQLEQLNLSRNALNNNLGSNSKALQSIGTLRRLDLSLNGLSDYSARLFLRNKTSLDELKMTGNSLIRLSRRMFQESNALRAVTLDDNLISVIEQGTFEPLWQLEILNLAQNNLAHICDFTLIQLKHLNLSHNSIEFFMSRENDHMYELEVLDLSFNKLLYFPIVPKMNQLKFLYLQNNMVGSLNSEASMVSGANSVYSDIMSEKIISKNNLHANWRLMPLLYIDLSYNHFTSFPLETLSRLSFLETLNFSYNCLQSITWNVRNYSNMGYQRQLYFPSLKQLYMKSNGLVNISHFFLKALTKIETLNLEDNSVQPCAFKGHLSSEPTQQMLFNKHCVAFQQLSTLKHLILRKNNIRILHANAFQQTSLHSLDLAGNIDMAMHLGALEGVQETLESLIISENNMTSCDLSLPCLPALSQLNLSNNHIDNIPSSLSCSPLMEIDIRNNAFVSLNRSLMRVIASNLQIMYFNGNYFNCCDREWFKTLKEFKIQLPDINDTTCFFGHRKVFMAEYMNSSSSYCHFQNKPQGVGFGYVLIVVLFVFVMITVFAVFTRKLCYAQVSLIV